MEERIVEKSYIGHISLFIFFCLVVIICGAFIRIVFFDNGNTFLMIYMIFSNIFIITCIMILSLLGAILGVISIIKGTNNRIISTMGLALNGMIEVCFIILIIAF